MSQPRTGKREALLTQQTALARFGEFALRSDDLTAILQAACRLVGGGLGTEFAKVMELRPDGQTLRVRAGTGWRPGIVGAKKVKAEAGSSDRLALDSGEAVVAPDLDSEERFTWPAFVDEHGVKAFVNVNILGRDGESPYGILEVDTRTPRQFTESDIDFLRTYANLIAAAVARFNILEDLRREAEEKARLFTELQHRVKNNMQVITSLIRIQSSRSDAPAVKEELRKFGFRIDALRLIHEKLHATGEAERVDLGVYLDDLTAALLRFYGEIASKVRLVTDIKPLSAPPEVAVPLGLIVNEFITNSLKYAFDGGAGTIGVRVEEPSPEGICVTLWDDGKGLPTERASGTGLYLIEGLARQVATEIHWNSDSGTELTLTLRNTAQPTG